MIMRVALCVCVLCWRPGPVAPAPAPSAVSGFPNLLSLGCWQDRCCSPDVRVLPHTNGAAIGSIVYTGNDPIGACMQFAQSQGDTYFALQSGGQCWSGADYRDYSAPQFDGSLALSACASPCANSTVQYCGGGFTNYVYQIVPPSGQWDTHGTRAETDGHGEGGEGRRGRKGGSTAGYGH